MIYCDTAYLARLYLLEPGSDKVRALQNSDGPFACSAHGRVELAFVFHRKHREGILGAGQIKEHMRQFESDSAAELLHWFAESEDLLQSAARAIHLLPRNVFLRAADALHLACARDHGFKVIYSNDERLLAAAPRFGLKGKNILA